MTQNEIMQNAELIYDDLMSISAGKKTRYQLINKIASRLIVICSDSRKAGKRSILNYISQEIECLRITIK